MSQKISQTIQILCFLMLLALTIRAFLPEKRSWSGEQQRALAVQLRTLGLELQAAREFQRYLDDYPVPAAERPGLYVTIGNIYYSTLDFSNALAYYGRAEALDRTFAGVRDVPSHYVDCLQKLGRKTEAEAARKRFTALDPGLAKTEAPKAEAAKAEAPKAEAAPAGEAAPAKEESK